MSDRADDSDVELRLIAATAHRALLALGCKYPDLFLKALVKRLKVNADGDVVGFDDEATPELLAREIALEHAEYFDSPK